MGSSKIRPPRNQTFRVETGQYPDAEKNILRTENKSCTLLHSLADRQLSLSVLRIPVIRSGAMATAALRLVEGSSMDKSKALDAALSQIERNFGKGSIMRLGKNPKSMDVETVSTGSLGLDIALGIGGLPRGRVVEIYGPESSGKTTLALHCVAEAQKKGGICAFVDAEHALDPVYARKLGRQCRRPSDLAARCRRAGARDRRHPGALRRGRRAGDRFGRGAGSARRARRRDGRQPCPACRRG